MTNGAVKGVNLPSSSLASYTSRRVLNNRWTRLILGGAALYVLTTHVFHFRRPVRTMSAAQDEGDLYGDALIARVYSPVDPGIYSAIYPEDPDPRVKEVANLFTELFQLFIDMQYISKENVAFPPHRDPSVDLKQAAKFGLTKDVVDLFQMIPYHSSYPNWNYGSDGGEFLKWGEFLEDLRQPDADWWTTIADPFYGLDTDALRSGDPSEQDWNQESGPYMRPWYATLTRCGNHGSIMILNTKNYHMWLIEQLGSSSDPFYRESSQYDNQTPNRNDLAQYPSRPANEFLRDIISRFRTLEWMPGGLYYPEQTEYKEFRSFYESAGWPDNFSPSLFERLREESETSKDALQKSFTPIDVLKGVIRGISYRETQRLNVIEIAEKLAQDDQMSEEERAKLLEQQNRAQLYAGTPESWAESQARTLADLEAQRSDLRDLKARTGRFAGMSEEDYNTAEKDGWFLDRITELENFLADESDEARDKRMLEEGKAAARIVTDETWAAFKEFSGVHSILYPNEWIDTDFLRKVIREDMKLDDIKKLAADVESRERTQRSLSE